MHDFVLDGFLMNVILLSFVLLLVKDGLGMAAFWLSGCLLWVGMVNGLGMCDFV